MVFSHHCAFTSKGRNGNGQFNKRPRSPCQLAQGSVLLPSESQPSRCLGTWRLTRVRLSTCLSWGLLKISQLLFSQRRRQHVDRTRGSRSSEESRVPTRTARPGTTTYRDFGACSQNHARGVRRPPRHGPPPNGGGTSARSFLPPSQSLCHRIRRHNDLPNTLSHHNTMRQMKPCPTCQWENHG